MYYPWIIPLSSLVNSWIIQGFCLDYPRWIDGLFLRFHYIIPVLSLRYVYYPWIFLVLSQDFQWIISGFSLNFQRIFPELSLDYP